MQNTTVQHNIMPNEHIIADDRWKAVLNPRHGAVAVDDAAVLNICPRANNHTVYLRTDDAIVPKAGLCADGNITHNSATRRDEGTIVNLRTFAIQRDDADICAGIGHLFFHSLKCGGRLRLRVTL
jgi:hypothetical protein